mmetsp:Transcript_12890/g.22273  ORF Transcript_12890/g.22273 Transcript_12890/m.22273 type:complete len:148 (-) Transcript_12890:710-1153(-)
MLGYLTSKASCYIVGFLYPAYASFHALRSPSQEDDRQWLIYWIIYALCNVFEFFLDLVIFWLPFYYEFKVFFILWLQLPQFRGAEWLYLQLQKYLDKHEGSFMNLKDDLLKKVVSGAKDLPGTAASASKMASDLLTNIKKKPEPKTQ